MKINELSTFCLQLIIATMIICPLKAMDTSNNIRKDLRIFNKRHIYKPLPTEEDLKKHKIAYIDYLRRRRDETLLVLEQLESLEQMPGKIDE